MSYIRLLDKRKKFQGEVNTVQNEALTHLYIRNTEETASLEEERLKMNILANNPELYKKLFMETEYTDDIEWFTPQNTKEAEEMIKQLEEVRVVAERFDAQ